MVVSSFSPMRRLSTSSNPASVLKRQPASVLTNGIGNGHASYPTTIVTEPSSFTRKRWRSSAILARRPRSSWSRATSAVPIRSRCLAPKISSNGAFSPVLRAATNAFAASSGVSKARWVGSGVCSARATQVRKAIVRVRERRSVFISTSID